MSSTFGEVQREIKERLRSAVIETASGLEREVNNNHGDMQLGIASTNLLLEVDEFFGARRLFEYSKEKDPVNRL